MAVCKTIRTKNSISEFLIQSENGDESVSAFRYVDGKIEVHSLRVECPPLYMDEKTCVSVLATEKYPSVLLSVTLKSNQSSIEFRAWDVVGTVATTTGSQGGGSQQQQGFHIKEFQSPLFSETYSSSSSKKNKENQHGKSKYTFSLKNHLSNEDGVDTSDSNSTVTEIACFSFKDLLCLVVDGSVFMLFRLKVSDTNGLITLEHKDTYKFTSGSEKNSVSDKEGEPSLSPVPATTTTTTTTIVHSLFLKGQDNKIYVAALEKQSISLLAYENGKLELSHTELLKGKSSVKLLRLTLSKCLIVDSQGPLSLFSVSTAANTEIVLLRLPSSTKGHNVCSAVGFKYTNEGILAVCNNDYTVNFYSLADVLCSVPTLNNNIKKAVFVKPYRVFCSQFPINAINFLRSDQLSMVSTVNQSITLLGGLSKGFS